MKKHTFLLELALSITLLLPSSTHTNNRYERFLAIAFPSFIGFSIGSGCIMSGLFWYYNYVYKSRSLPAAFKECKQFEIQYIPSRHQGKDECGWFAVMNAVAIQQLVRDGKPITSRAIKKIVSKKLIPLIKKNKKHVVSLVQEPNLWGGIKLRGMERLRNFLGLESAYAVMIPDVGHLPILYNERVLNENQLDCIRSFSGDPSCCYIFLWDKFLSSIIQSPEPVVHFLISAPCNDSDRHAVVISIVKRPKKKPLLIYMDSNNFPFHRCSLQYVVPYISMKLIQQLDSAAKECSVYSL